MSFNRVAISQALFTRFANSYEFATTGRRLRLWSEVLPEERPALFLHKGREEYVGASRGTPAVTHLYFDIFVYVNTKDSEAPSDVLDDILDALEKCFNPEPFSGKITLGGLCDHVWKDGMGVIVPGDLDGDGIAVIPLKVRVA